MTNVLGVPSRFGCNLYIKDSDIQKAVFRHEASTNSSSLTDIWERIKDWFFGTNLVEAKRHLMQLYTPTASDADRVASYRALKDLVGDGFRDRFVEKVEPFGYSRTIDYGDYLPPYHHTVMICSREYLQKSSNQLVSKVLDASGSKNETNGELAAHEKQLANDLPRACYSVSGKPIADLDTPDNGLQPETVMMNRLNVFRSALEAEAPLPEQQRTAVEVLASQGVFADITCSTYAKNGGGLYTDDNPRGNSGQLNYDLSRSGSDIILRATRRADEWLPNPDDRPLSPMLLTPTMSVSMAIAPNGHVRVLSANFGTEPYGA